MMMKKVKNQTSEIKEGLNFPKKGEILNGTQVLKSHAEYQDSIFRYEIQLPKGTKSRKVPSILKTFFSTQVVPSDNNLIVKHHDYTVRPKNGNVAVIGAMHIIPSARANPGALEFDQEYSEMVMNEPERFFKKYPYKSFNNPSGRAKLFSLVSFMGENYGYTDGTHLYHRRASLIMPKIKITKAIKGANMMYHTHPRKDEPSLSSAEDYLLYMDLSHKPRGIKNFCTVMADRMDEFQIVPKKGSKDRFLKLEEDKILKEIDGKISELEKKWDTKTPRTGKYEDDLRFCENITRDLVKWLNKKYKNYFTFKYKCHYKVKKNPAEPESTDLHLEDAFLQKAIGDLRTQKYGWPQFETNFMPHEKYAYWHQMYYTHHVKDSAMTIGISPQAGWKRMYDQYMSNRFGETKYTNLDALNILNLAYDIAVADAKIRDGTGLKSRMKELCEYLEITGDDCDTLVLLEQVVNEGTILSESAQTVSGDYYPLTLLAFYSRRAIETIVEVESGKKSLDLARYEIYTKLKGDIGEKLYSFLGKTVRLPANGFVDSYLNPPELNLYKVEGTTDLPKEAFEIYDIVTEALSEFSRSKYDISKKMYVKGRWHLRVPTKEGIVSVSITQSTGTAQFFAKSIDSAFEAISKIGQALYRAGLPIDPEEFDIDLDDPVGEVVVINPQPQVIAISGPSGSGKSTTIRNLLKMLPNSKTAPTVTTRQKRASDKKGERIFVSKKEFENELRKGDLIAAKLQKNGNYYGRRLDDFKGADYVIVDVTLSGLNDIKRKFPNTFSVYLEPVEDPAFIRKRLLKRGDMSMQEARKRSEIIPSHIESSKAMDFDLRIQTRQGQFDAPAKEISDMIPRVHGPIANPSKKITSVRIEESPNKEKKMVAYFFDEEGKKVRTTHFGARGMSDFTQHKDPKRMKRYLARHSKMGEDWKDPTTAGALSRWILWGKPSLRESFNDYKKKFRLEGVMTVTNTKMNPPTPHDGDAIITINEVPWGTQIIAECPFDGTKGGVDPWMEDACNHIYPPCGHVLRINPDKPCCCENSEHPPTHPDHYRPNPAFIVGKEDNKFDIRVVAPTRDPIMIESLRAATDPSFVHHEWYVKHHLDYVMAIAHALKPRAQPDEKEIINHMVWMHDYPKMMGDKENFELVRELVAKHKGKAYADELVGYLEDMEMIKSVDSMYGVETTIFALIMSTADALAHYYGPFFQIYHDENPDTPIEELKQKNAEKLEKDKRKLRAGPMEGALDSIKFQYRGRKVRVVGNEHIAKLIEKKNPKTPGGKTFPKRYLTGLNKEERAIAMKEIDKGYKYDTDDPKAYEYWKSDIKATARGYKTVPSKYKKKFIEMYGPMPEKGDFITKISKATKIKKSIIQKVYDKGLAAWRVGHRPGVQQHQWAAGRVYSFVTIGDTVKKGKRKMGDYKLAVEAGLVKDNPSTKGSEETNGFFVQKYASQDNPDISANMILKHIAKKNYIGSGVFGTTFKIPNTDYVLKIQKRTDPDYYTKLTKWIHEGAEKPKYPENLTELYRFNWPDNPRIGLPVMAIGGPISKESNYNVVMKNIRGYTIGDFISPTKNKYELKRYSLATQISKTKTHLKNVDEIPQKEWNRLVRDHIRANEMGITSDLHSYNIILDPEKSEVTVFDYEWEYDGQEKMGADIGIFEEVSAIWSLSEIKRAVERTTRERTKRIESGKGKKPPSSARRLSSKKEAAEVTKFLIASYYTLEKAYKRFLRAARLAGVPIVGFTRVVARKVDEDISYLDRLEDYIIPPESVLIKLGVAEEREGRESERDIAALLTNPKEPSADDFFPGNTNVAHPSLISPTISITSLQNPNEWRHGAFAEDDPFEEYF